MSAPLTVTPVRRLDAGLTTSEPAAFVIVRGAVSVIVWFSRPAANTISSSLPSALTMMIAAGSDPGPDPAFVVTVTVAASAEAAAIANRHPARRSDIRVRIARH